MDRALWARRPSGRTSRARRWALCVVSLSLIGGTLGEILLPSAAWWFSLVAAFAAGSGAGKKSDRALWLLAALGVAAGVGVAGRSLEEAADVPGAGRLQRLEVEVRRVAEGTWPSGSRWVRLSADVLRGDNDGLPKGALVEVLFSRARSDWHPGDRFRLVARPYPPLGLCNAGKDDRQGYARRHGTLARLRIKDDRAVEKMAASQSLRVRVRAAIAEAIDRGAPGKAGPILHALVLGERHSLDRERREYWAAAGVAHLLVVSGLHLAAVFWGAQMLLGFLVHLLLPVGHGARARLLSRILVLGVVSSYLMIVGFSVAVARAAMVAFLLQFQEFFGGRARPFHFLLATAAGFLMWDPGYAGAVGFQLTFLATGALMLAGGGAASSFAARLIRAGRFSLVAVAATAPILAYHFGEFSLAGIIVNLIVGPVLGPGVLAPALPGAFLAPLDIGLASRLLRVAAVMIDAVEPLIAAVGETRLGVVRADGWLPIGAAGVAALLIGSGFRRWGWERWLVVVGGVLLVAVVWRTFSGPLDRSSLRVRFLDVGQGDAILFAGPGEVAGTLIDLPGRLSAPGLATRVVRPVLRAEGLSGLRRIVVSHADWDHAGGIDDLWSLYPRAEFAVSHGSRLPEEEGRWIPPGRARWKRLGTGDQFGAGWGRVDVLQPGKHGFANRNDNSLVLALRYGATSVLFTGDIEAAGESMLGGSADLPGATVLKVPHHGSRTSSGVALLARLRPAAAVVQAARRNRFDFPHSEVVERYRQLGVAWLVTAEAGEIRMVSDGQISRLQRCRR